MPTLADVIKYLQEEQALFKFSEDFLAKPDVKSWLLQALIDATSSGSLPYDKYAETKQLGDYIYNGGPNDNLPHRSHTVSAVKLVYNRFQNKQ